MENFKFDSPEEGILKREDLGELEEIFARMAEQGNDPHLENVKIDNLAGEDWEIFRKFLDNNLIFLI